MNLAFEGGWPVEHDGSAALVVVDCHESTVRHVTMDRRKQREDQVASVERVDRIGHGRHDLRCGPGVFLRVHPAPKNSGDTATLIQPDLGNGKRRYAASGERRTLQISSSRCRAFALPGLLATIHLAIEFFDVAQIKAMRPVGEGDAFPAVFVHDDHGCALR